MLKNVALLVLLAAGLSAQSGGGGGNTITTNSAGAAPAGAGKCSFIQLINDSTNGNFYYCDARTGTYTLIGFAGGIVPIANGGTGSATQNFVDLSTTQASIGGAKTFTVGLADTQDGNGNAFAFKASGSTGAFIAHLTNAAGAAFNNLVQAGDNALVYSDNNGGCGSGGLNLVPWAVALGGMRLPCAGGFATPKFAVDLNGAVSTVLGTNTSGTGGGVPSFTGSATTASFSTTQTNVSILASSKAATQQYVIGYSLYQSANGSGGVCNTNSTVTPAITYTDPASNTHVFTAGAISLKPTSDAGTEAADCSAATGSGGCRILRTVKASSAITITYTYANGNCNTQPQASALAYAEVVN